MFVDSFHCSLFKDFPLLLFERLHGDGVGWATVGAETTANALLFVLDDGAGLAGLEFRSGQAVASLNQSVVTIVAAYLREVDEAQAVLRAYVHAAGAKDALRSIEDGVDLAVEAAEAFGAALFLIEA